MTLMPQRKLLLSFRNLFKKIAAVFLIISIPVLLLTFFFAPLFIKIKKIECASQFGECPVGINEQISKYKGENFIKIKKNISKILDSEKSINEYTLQFKLPSAVRVDLLIKKPSFCVKSDETFLLISENGEIIAKSQDCALPRIITSGINKSPGDMVDGTTLYLLKIIQGIYTMYQVQEATVTDNSLTVELKDGLAVIFPVKGVGDPSAKLGALRLIYTKIENEGINIHEIDLRFENPVLR